MDERLYFTLTLRHMLLDLNKLGEHVVEANVAHELLASSNGTLESSLHLSLLLNELDDRYLQLLRVQQLILTLELVQLIEDHIFLL